MDKAIDLSVFPFFSGISKDRLREIEDFSILQSYEKGATVFENNEPARNLYGLNQGSIDLFLLFREEVVTKKIKYEEYISTNVEVLEKPIVIETIANKDVFGWSAMVAPEKMTATAKCVNDCEVVLIPSSKLKKVCSRDPELGYQLSERLNTLIASRLNTRTERLVEAWCSLFETVRIDTE